jgi:mono/diheme cytochrome c family protein
VKLLSVILLLLLPALAAAEDYNARRALYHYQLYCQGCHTPDGAGANAVPRMKDHVGYFLETRRGREYLVRVPGSATSTLDDAELAEVLNWIVLEFAGPSSDDAFQRYTAEEVGHLRQSPLNEVMDYREALLLEIANNRIDE